MPGVTRGARVPNLLGGMSDKAMDGTVNIGYGQGTLISADTRAIRGKTFVNLVPFYFFIQNLASGTTTATALGVIQNTTVGAADHLSIITPRAGSIVGFCAQANAAVTTGSCYLRARWGGTFISALPIELKSGTQTQARTQAKNAASSTVPSNTKLQVYARTNSTYAAGTLDYLAYILMEF